MNDINIRIAVVEDSADDLSNCLSLLNRYSKEKNISFDIQTFASGDAFLMRFKSQYDFIILDINLSAMNGIDVARKIREKDEEVIIMFTTNLAKYATNGYEVDAIDFVLKPLSYASFYLRLERVMKKLGKKNDNFIVVPNEGGFNKIETNNILYVEVISHDIIFHLKDNQEITTTGTLKKFEEQLRKKWFIRCNSCYLVNAHNIKRVEKLDIQLANDEIIAISHPKKKGFMESFKKYIMEEGNQRMDLKTLLTMFISFTVEILVASVLLIKHRLTFRFKPYISIPVGLLIASSGAVANIIGLHNFVKPEQWNELLNIAVYTIPIFTIYGGLLFAYKIKPLSLMLLLSVAYTFQHMAYQVGVLVLDTGLSGKIFQALYNESEAIEVIVNRFNIIYNSILYTLKTGVFVACYFLIARYYVKYSKYIIGKLMIIILGIVVYLVVNVANVYVAQHLTWDAKLRGILAGTLIIFCILFDVLVVGGFRVVEHRQETMIIKATLNSKIRQQEMMENNINFINMKCHDLRKELRRLKAKKGELTDEDFCLLEESLNFYDSSVKTGNVNIDALIQDKLIYCNSMGIEFTSLVDGDAFKEMASSDVYFLLTNIIDNAIEATEAIQEKEHRVISLTASRKHGMLMIEETNYYHGELVFNNDGSIKTTKQENKKYHGFGTKSIAYIVKKYNGTMDYETKDGIFRLKIAM